jgi:ribosomal protein L32E
MDGASLTAEQLCRKRYYEKNKEKVLNHKKETYKRDKEKILRHKKETYKLNSEKIYAHNLENWRSPKGKMVKMLANRRRHKGFGFKPINNYFENSHFHHMHINESTDIGIFIPESLHRSIYHNGTTKQGIDEINKASLLWLAEQCII